VELIELVKVGSRCMWIWLWCTGVVPGKEVVKESSEVVSESRVMVTENFPLCIG